MTTQYTHTRRVQFYETDVAGIVHFSWFFRYLEEAEHAMWRSVGLSSHPERSEIGWPRVAASCEFHRPLKFEQEFDISVHISELGKRAISYAGKITRNGDRIATASWKIACVSRLPDGNIRSAEIPADVADRLKPFAHRPSDIA